MTSSAFLLKDENYPLEGEHMNIYLKIAIVFLILINIYSFIIMYLDKQRAKHKKWRVPELTLFILAACLGSPGILMGMYSFRHKTKHIKFTIGIPLILAVQLYLLYKLCNVL